MLYVFALTCMLALASVDSQNSSFVTEKNTKDYRGKTTPEPTCSWRTWRPGETYSRVSAAPSSPEIDTSSPPPTVSTRELRKQLVSGAYPNDVALLRLAANSVIGSGHHIPLAKPDDGDRTGETCTIMGRGLTESGIWSSVLLETDGNILSSSECAGYWKTNYNHNVHICINNKNSGACNVYNGGPMICNNQLVGVTSWGMSGCNVTVPSVYTRISSFNDWFTSKTSTLFSHQIPVPVLY